MVGRVDVKQIPGDPVARKQGFPRIVGLRDGRILFDKPSTAVSPVDLEALYANEQLQAQRPVSPPPAPVSLHIPRC